MWGYLCKNKIYDCGHQVESTVDSGLCDFKLKFRFSEKAPIFENDIPIFLTLLINVKFVFSKFGGRLSLTKHYLRLNLILEIP